MEKRKISKYVVIFTITILAFALASCSKNAGSSTVGKGTSSDTVKIAYLPITHSLAVLEEAEELKNSTGLKIELVKYGSWPELLDALNTGQVDGAEVLIELAMKSKQEGIGIKVVALGHKDGNVIVTNKNIKSVADLKGKKFAIPHRQSSHNILLHDALATAGLTTDDLEVVELAPTEMPSALVAGQIDGYCVAEPFGAKAVSLDVGQVLLKSEVIWKDSLCCGLVLTDTFLNNRPDDAKSFVENYKTAGKNLTTKKAKEIAKKYLSADDTVLDLSLQWISYNDLEITEETYNTLLEKVKKYGLSDNPPAFDDFVKNDF